MNDFLEEDRPLSGPWSKPNPDLNPSSDTSDKSLPNEEKKKKTSAKDIKINTEEETKKRSKKLENNKLKEKLEAPKNKLEPKVVSSSLHHLNNDSLSTPNFKKHSSQVDLFSLLEPQNLQTAVLLGEIFGKRGGRHKR